MSKAKPFIVSNPVLSSAHTPEEPVEQGNLRERRTRELADSLRRCKGIVPHGEFHVDAEALRQVRAATPGGELHRFSRSSGGCVQSTIGGRCVLCGQRHVFEPCVSTMALNL